MSRNFTPHLEKEKKRNKKKRYVSTFRSEREHEADPALTPPQRRVERFDRQKPMGSVLFIATILGTGEG